MPRTARSTCLLAIASTLTASAWLTVLAGAGATAAEPSRTMLHDYLIEQAGLQFEARRLDVAMRKTPEAVRQRQESLKARFRDHTNDLFRKHGMEIIGFWTPTEGPKSQNTLIYILAYPSKEAADKAWKAFREDPDWIKAKDASEKDGPLVKKVDSTYLKPTDFSPMK